MEERIERIKKQLHAASYKLTPQREATVRVLLENEEDHLSAEDVYHLLGVSHSVKHRLSNFRTII